jgi:ERCC4-type nuclease
MNKALGSVAVPCPIKEGDAVFWGVGENETTIKVCVERKRLSDMVNSILGGRYLSQVQAAHEAGFSVYVLIVETGIIRSNPEDGMIDILVWGTSPRTGKRAQVWQPLVPTISYSRFDQYLTELDWLAGVIVKRSIDVQETAAIIKALWVNFQTAPSGHQSLKQIYKAPLNEVLLVKPSLVRRIVSELPGIGWQRSGDVAERFRSVQEMVAAGVKDWESIPGIGKVTARKAVEALHGGLSDK